jgi:hypothetical protein
VGKRKGRFPTGFWGRVGREGFASSVDGWAKFIVYGHTHHYEMVSIQPVQQGNTVTNQIYINSGTWRPVHELARFHPGQKQFVGYHAMTYLTFFKGDETKGKGV